MRTRKKQKFQKKMFHHYIKKRNHLLYGYIALTNNIARQATICRYLMSVSINNYKQYFKLIFITFQQIQHGCLKNNIKGYLQLFLNSMFFWILMIF